MKKYEPKLIEPKWQQVWADSKLYAAVDGDQTRPKFYMLTEFPYPSGAGLHAGSAREYTLGDVMARYKRMQGYNVLFPMGYDAFGLPTENFAIKHKVSPQAATARNTANFRRQLEALGYSIDWDREVNTSDPAYYRWTQWLFLRFLEEGLAYQAELPINWCPKEKTGLANEEVVDGKHERCGTPVEKKLLKQWVLRITKYADRLIEGLATVDYPERIASQQINWIGRSEGAEIDFAVGGADGAAETVVVYTTRPDTLAGATFLVLAPEHAAVARVTTAAQREAVAAYVKQTQAESEVARQETERPMTGVWTGAMARNPVSGREMPVWVADYVLAGYGTGAIMAVPAHDERDWAFAKAFALPVAPVIARDFGERLPDAKAVEGVVVIGYDPKTRQYLGLKNGPQGWLIGGGRESGESFAEAARRELAEEAGYDEVVELIQLGPPVYSYYYNDIKKSNRRSLGYNFLAVLDSTRRGQARPEAHESFEVQWTPFEELYADIAQTGGGVEHWLEALNRAREAAARIDDGEAYEEGYYTGGGVLVNSGRFDGLGGAEAKRAVTKWLAEQGLGRVATKYKLRDWIFSRQHYWGEPIPVVHCLEDGVVPVPEDQLPVELPAVEYYEPTETGESPLAAITEWVNTTCPTCGGPAQRETDTMPNWAGSSWYWLRYMDARGETAFAAREKLDYWGMVDMYLGGMEHTTLHLLYSRFWHEFLYDQGLVPTPEPYAARRGQGILLASDGRKMSKSLGNVVNPIEVVERYGADAFRLYVLFMAPYDEATAWSEERLGGVSRFVYRVWGLVQELAEGDEAAIGGADGDQGVFEAEVDRMAHKTLKRVHDGLHEMRFNTTVSALMELVNFLNGAAVKGRLRRPESAAVRQRSLRALVLMLAPAAPHVTEELWRDLGETGSVHVAGWPQYDPALIRDEVVTVTVQVNGRVRGTVMAAVDASEAELVELARGEANVVRHLADAEVTKTVVVPRRLVNFVVRAR